MGIGIKELWAKATPTGMVKGAIYPKELGAESDGVKESHQVIFPFCTRTGKNGAPRSEFQLRIPIDDTHTYHICYQVYAAPAHVPAPRQDVIPWYEPPLVDEHGNRILDYVLSQDLMAWTAQGPICDREEEVLGRTDTALAFMRKQLDEQIALVEAGKPPLNFYRESPEMLATATEEAPAAMQAESLRYRGFYHKGFNLDDMDRYGPAMPLIQDLHRRIEEAALVSSST